MSFALDPDDETASLVGLLDGLLDQGVHVAGDLVIGLADVALVRASLRLLVASEDTAQRTGRGPTPTAAGRDRADAPASATRHGSAVGSREPGGQEPAAGRRRPAGTGATAGVRGQDDEQALVDGVARLVLTVVAVIHDLVERQAIRRVEAGSLSDEQVERLGVALQALEERMAEVRAAFGVTEDELNLDLGPLGSLR